MNISNVRFNLSLVDDSTPALIRNAACRLFAANGFHATSIRDIADQAGVNVAAINYHFGSKEGLLARLMTDFASGKLQDILALLEPPQSPAEFRLRFEMFAGELIRLCCEQDDMNKMVHSHIDLFAQIAPEAFRDSFVRISRKTEEFFRVARDNGLTRDDLDPTMITAIAIGTLADMCRTHRLREQIEGVSLNDPAFRQSYVRHLVEIILTSVETKR